MQIISFMEDREVIEAILKHHPFTLGMLPFSTLVTSPAKRARIPANMVLNQTQQVAMKFP